MKRRIRFNLNTLLVGLMVLYSIYALEPFFIWETYKGGIFRHISGIPFMTLFGIGFIVCYFFKYHRIRISKGNKFLIFELLICAFCQVGLSGGIERTSIFSLAWIPFIIIMLFILLPEVDQERIYSIFSSIIAVSLAISIIIYILLHIGINIPYTRLESFEPIKVFNGGFYKLYGISAQYTSIYKPIYEELRLSGVFDEAGRVGTLCGLILCSEGWKIRSSWKNIILLVAGILSFSLAFYLIAILFYVLSCFKRRNYKHIAIVVIIIIAYFAFTNIKFTNDNLIRLQSRVLFTSNGLAGNNRTNDAYNAILKDFNESDIYSILFGKGFGAIAEVQAENNVDGSSYKSMIYNFGYLGFTLSLFWLFLYTYENAKNEKRRRVDYWILLAIYLANMYQRPSNFYIGYMLIFFGGIQRIKRSRIQAPTNEKVLSSRLGKKKTINTNVNKCMYK